MCPPFQAVKVLRTAEFVPYVVFIEAPGPERLRAMNRAALESGVATKQLTVRARGDGETEAGLGRGQEDTVLRMGVSFLGVKGKLRQVGVKGN